MTAGNKTTQALHDGGPITSPPGLIQQLAYSDISPLSLGYLFDNIRNYTLSATVMVAGLWLITRGHDLLGIPYINWVFGVHVTLCGLILTGLNFLHSLRTITRTQSNKWPAYVIFITLLVGSLELVGVALWKLSS